MKSIVFHWIWLSLLFLIGCSPIVLPEESGQAGPTIVPPPEYSTTVVPSPTPTLVPCGYFPTPDPSFALSQKNQVEPPQTPLPDRGVRVSKISQVSPSVISLASQENICLDHISTFDVDGNILVGITRIIDGIIVIAFDLETREIRQLSQALNESPSPPLISGRRVIWTENALDLGENMSRLQMFDLDQNRLTTLKEGNFRYVDFSKNTIIWQARHNLDWNIYGYNLATKQDFTGIERPLIQSFPQICSDEWFIYLQYEGDWPTQADLFAHHLPSHEDILIGQVPFPREVITGQHHKCDDPYVAWISNVQEEVVVQQWNSTTNQFEARPTQTYRQHLYNLRTHTDRTLDIPPGLPAKVNLDGNILIGTAGYDLQRNIPFELYPPNLPVEQRPAGQLSLSGNRLVWQSAPYAGPKQLFTGLIIHD